jgi:hypothetical protein
MGKLQKVLDDLEKDMGIQVNKKHLQSVSSIITRKFKRSKDWRISQSALISQ